MQGPGPVSNHSSSSGDFLKSSRVNEVQRNFNSNDFSDYSDAPSDNGMYTQENNRVSSLALDGGGPERHGPDTFDYTGAVGQMQGTGQCSTVSNGDYLGSSESADNRYRDRGRGKEHSSHMGMGMGMGMKSPLGADNHRYDVSHASKGSPTHLIDHIQQALSDRGSPLNKIKDSSRTSAGSSNSEKKRKREKLLYVNLAKSSHFLDRSMNKNREHQEVNANALSKAREVNNVDAKELILPNSTSSSSSSSSGSSSFKQYRIHGMSTHANIPATILDSDSFSGPCQSKPPCRNAANGSESHPDNGIAELLLSMAVAHPMPCPSPALFLPSAVMSRHPTYGTDLDLSRTSHGRQITSQQFASQQQPCNDLSNYQVKHAVLQQDFKEGSSPSDTFLNPL